MNIKVSIIIPVYNTEKFLNRCLDSVINQTYSDYEIICVDDYSDDKSREILKAYEQRYHNIRCFYNDKNLGQGRSRMLGIDKSYGKYIMFVDSDDYIAPNYIEVYMNTVQKTKCDVVVGGFITDNGKKKKKHSLKQSENVECIISYSYACFKLYNKAFLLDNKIDFGKYRKGEDIYFSLCLVLAGAKHEIIEYCGYYYFVNLSSTTRTITYDCFFEKNVSEMFEMLNKYRDYKNNIELYNYMEYAYIASMINAILVFSKGCGIRLMKEKYNYFLSDLKNKFPDYKRNNNLYRWRKKGASFRCRMAVFLIMNSMKLHIDSAIFYIFSVL